MYKSVAGLLFEGTNLLLWYHNDNHFLQAPGGAIGIKASPKQVVGEVCEEIIGVRYDDWEQFFVTQGTKRATHWFWRTSTTGDAFTETFAAQKGITLHWQSVGTNLVVPRKLIDTRLFFLVALCQLGEEFIADGLNNATLRNG